MAKHKRFTSIENAQSAVPGDGTKTAGHDEIGLFVIAENLDPQNDTLEMTGHVSAEDEHYATVDIGATKKENVLDITADDFRQSDADDTVYVAYRAAHNIPTEYVRAVIDSFTDASGDGDLSVTAYIFMSGWTGRGKSYNERTDTPTNY